MYFIPLCIILYLYAKNIENLMERMFFLEHNDGRLGAFASNINQYNPTPDADALSIVGLVKSGGKISGYQLSDGRRVNRDEGVQMAKNNKIRGVGVASKKGTQYLRALPDGNENNNLSNLPTVAIE